MRRLMYGSAAFLWMTAVAIDLASAQIGTPRWQGQPGGGLFRPPAQQQQARPPAQTAFHHSPYFQSPAHFEQSLKDEQLIAHLDQAIQATSSRFLVANVHSPWQIFHGILALHKDFKLKLGEQKVSAIDWIATSQPMFDGEPWIVTTPAGTKFHPFSRPYAFEGHPAQFLGLLSESNLPTSYTFRIANGQVTIGEMLNTAMKEVNDKEEITWVLWALNHYLRTDAQWANMHGEPWSIEKLVQVQVVATVENGACGGNHGLYVLSKCRDKLLAEGRPLRGAWYEADQKVMRYIEVVRSLQNSDGSLSADFYKGQKYSQDINTRLNTSGHTFEFLSVGLPQRRLQEPWVRQAAATLAKDLIDNRKTPVECGPLYHSLNGLIIYRNRLRAIVSPGNTVPDPTELANANSAPAKSNPSLTLPVQPTPALNSPSLTKPEVAANPIKAEPVPQSLPTNKPDPLPMPSNLDPTPAPLQPVKEPVTVQPTPEEKPTATDTSSNVTRLPPLNLAPQSLVGSESPRPSGLPEPIRAPAVDDLTDLKQRLLALKKASWNAEQEAALRLPTLLPEEDVPVSAIVPANSASGQ